MLAIIEFSEFPPTQDPGQLSFGALLAAELIFHFPAPQTPPTLTKRRADGPDQQGRHYPIDAP